MNRSESTPNSQEDLDAFEAIIANRSVVSAYQPIVDLESGATVGWEALARGPKGSTLEFPDQLFGFAASVGRTDELDFVCRFAALKGALDARLGPQQELFVNVEPSVTTSSFPPFLEQAQADAWQSLRGTVEITERALTQNPAELFALIDSYRKLGWGIALDDVGIDPRSVALMPFVRPDVIKLDMSYVQLGLDRSRARTVHAVLAEAERAGARVLAEGIETAEHLAAARGLGAELGQGWYFGRPGELTPGPSLTRGTGRTSATHLNVEELEGTPFEFLSGKRPVRTSTKRDLLERSLALEDEALLHGEAALLISTFQDASYFTTGTASRYEGIANQAAFVGAIAVALGEEPAAGVRGASIPADDVLCGEWDVVVLGPHFAGGFVARDLGDKDVPDMDRRFDHALTHDRELVTALAARLLQRIAPSTDEPAKAPAAGRSAAPAPVARRRPTRRPRSRQRSS